MANEALKGYEEESLSSHEIMANIGEEALQRFVAFQELFETSGWKLIEEYAQGKSTVALYQGSDAPTWEDNRVAKGYRTAWDEIANLAAQTMNEFEQLAREQIEAQEDDFDPSGL